MVEDFGPIPKFPIKKNKNRRKKRGAHKKNWEKLGERGVIGLSATPGLGITSTPIASKALPRLARRTLNASTRSPLSRIGRSNDVFNPDAINGDPWDDNTVQDGTIFERPAIPKTQQSILSGIKGRMTNMNPYMGDDNLVRTQASQVEKFKKWASSGDWESFDYEHYDWWTFPIDKGSAQYGYMFDVTGEPLERLKKNKSYLDSLRSAAILYAQSHGWDLTKRGPLSADNLPKSRYLNVPINGQRFFKIARSLQIHDLTPEFNAFRELVEIYRKKYNIGNDDYWNNPNKYVMKSRYRQNNQDNISGKMSGLGINPEIFSNSQDDPRLDSKFQKQNLDRDNRNTNIDASSGDLTFDWRKDDTRRAFIQKFRDGSLKRGYADFTKMNMGAGRHDPGPKKGLNPKLDLDLIADLGLHWRPGRKKGYPGFVDPYGSVFTHSISAKNEDGAHAAQVRNLKGYFSPTINPKLYWQRFESWIRNPFVVMRDTDGREIGLRLYFKDNRELMIKEFNNRINKLFVSINSKYNDGLDFKPLPEHENIFDETEVPKFIRDQIDDFLKSPTHRFQKSLTIDSLKKNILNIFETKGIGKLLNKLDNSWIEKYLQKYNPGWLTKKLRTHPNFLRANVLDNLNFDDLSSGQDLMELAFIENGNAPDKMDLNKIKTELFPEKVYTPEIVEALHRGQAEILYSRSLDSKPGNPGGPNLISGQMNSGLPPKIEDLTYRNKKWKDKKRTFSPFEEIYSFQSQVVQYPQNGPSGISYFRGASPWMEEQGKWVDALLFRDDNGRVRGILNHYPFDLIDPENPSVREERGNINIFIDPLYKNKRVGTALLDEAISRYDVDLNKQNYSTEGAAFINAYVRKLPENAGKEPRERYNRDNRPSKIHMKMVKKLEKKLEASSRLKLQKFSFTGPDGEKYDSSIINIGKRPVVIVDIYDVNVPFYMSSGVGGKEKVIPGQWYPFFGVAKTGWLNKTNETEMADYYNVPEFKLVAEILNNLITKNDIPDSRTKWNNGDKEWGVFRNPYESYTNYPVKDSVIESLHKDMLPAERGDTKNLNKNILNVKLKIEKNKQNISGRMSTQNNGLAEFEKDSTPIIPKKELTEEDIEIINYPDSDVPAFKLNPIPEIISIIHPDNPNKSKNPDLQNDDYDYKNYLNGIQYPTEKQIKKIKKHIAEQEKKYKKITHGWKFVLSNGETKEDFKSLPYLRNKDNPVFPNIDWVDVTTSDGKFLFRVSKLKNLDEFELRHDILEPGSSREGVQQRTVDSLFEEVLRILSEGSQSEDHPGDLLDGIMTAGKIPMLWDPPYGDLNMVKIDALARGYDPATKFSRDNFSGVNLTFGDSPEAKFIEANINRSREAIRLNSEFTQQLMIHLNELRKKSKMLDAQGFMGTSYAGTPNETESLLTQRNKTHGPNTPNEELYQVRTYAFNYNAVDPFSPAHEMLHIAGGQGFDRHGDHTVNRMLKFIFPNHWHIMYNYITGVQDFSDTLGWIPSWIQIPENLMNQPRRDDRLGLPSPEISGKMSISSSNIKSINASNISFDKKNPANLLNHATSAPSAYLSLPEPTDDLDVAIESGRPISWLIPGQLNPMLNEHYNSLVKELRELNDGQGHSNGTSYEQAEQDFLGSPYRNEKLAKRQRELTEEFGKVSLRYQMIFRALLEMLGVENDNDKSLIAAGLVLRASSTVAQAVHLGQKYDSLNMTEEMLASLNEDVQLVFDAKDFGLSPRPVVNVPIDKLDLILNSGQLKTQFDTGTSVGNFNPDTRRVQEFAMFSIHPRTNKRPIYGSIRMGTTEDISEKTQDYGAATIVLKEEVVKRTTWTQADSLSIQVSASSLSPENRTWDGLYNQSIHQRLKILFFWGPDFDEQMQEMGRSYETEQWPYIESQIHGGVNLSDIAYVIVDEDFYKNQPELIAPFLGEGFDENNWRESPKWIQISRIAEINNIPIIFLRKELERSEIIDDEVFG